MKSSTYLYARISRATHPAGVLLLAAIFSGTLAFGQARNVPPELSGAAANQKIQGAEYIQQGTNTTYPSFIRMNAASSVQTTQFVPWIKKSLNIPAGTDFQLMKQETDKVGLTHDRYVQTYLSVPIDNAQIVVNSKDGRIAWMSTTLTNAPSGLNPKPVLSEAQALKAAMKAIGAKQYKWESDYWMKDLRNRTHNPNATYLPKGLLCWNVSDDNKTLVLAYRFDIESANPDKVQRIYVNANTGAALKKVAMESNCSSASVVTVFDGSRTIFTDNYSGSLYRLRNDCRGSGGGSAEFWIRDWGSTTLSASPTEIENTSNTWTTNQERFGGSVLWLVDRCYAYWNASPRSRNSYDNSGGDIDGYINAKFDCSPPAGCVSDFNASMSFSGGHLKVGKGSGFADGYATVDIIGHEFTHAVTGSTSGLVYDGESGALNESFSDIFGEATENFVFGSNDWLLGEQRSSHAIRDMSNPKAKGQPDTYQGTNWQFPSDPSDAHGVHTNSGVQNYWFYLITVGGSGTNDNSQAYNVSGVGLATASQVAYLNDISLPSGATYAQARAGAIAVAITMSGSACSNLVKQVTNAWYAVGVGSQFFDASVAVTSNYNGRDVTCHDACNGSAAVSVVSGVAPTYSWSPSGGTGATATGLCPGVYTVTITNHDAAACVITRNVTIQNTPLLVAAPAATSHYNGYNISCNGAHDGSAAANASGGTGPYTYNWNTVPAQHGSSATNLGAGTYTVQVIDANGCSTSQNVTLTEPPLLTTTAAPITNYNGYNVRCHGGSDGAAEAFPVGGVAPYSYSWNTVPVQTTKVANNLSAQMYTVNVTDLNGCGASANTTLTEPPQLTIDAGANKVVYYGYPDSSCATLTATGMGGGVPPYVITWSTGAHTAAITVCPITSTIYYVTLTDMNNCSFTDSVRVCVIDVRCGNKLDKVELCHYTGSSSNPSNTLCVALSGAKAHLAHGDQLAACGTNKICTFGAGGFARINLLGAEGEVELAAFPNPLSDFTTVRFIVPSEQHVQLGLYDMSGRLISNIYNGMAKADLIYENRVDASSLAAGMYFLNLKLENGKSYTGKLVITK
jgi:Zn-dependent metalloprotease